MEREFEIVVWGATGFTGKLVAEFLLEQYGASGELCWALGGRNREKLEALRTDLGPGASGLELVVGDGGDASAMAALAERTQVVCDPIRSDVELAVAELLLHEGQGRRIG